MQDSLEHLRATINAFVAERDWAQFHTPKNLAMAMIVEAAELVEQFQCAGLPLAQGNALWRPLPEDGRQATTVTTASIHPSLL